MFEGPWRASDVESWAECGHRYELQRERLEPPAWRHPKGINGTALHLAIAQIHEEKLWGAPAADLLDRWKAAMITADETPYEEADRGVPVWWGEYVDRQGAIDAMRSDATAMLSGYADDPRNRDAALVGLELFWETDIGGVPMRGRIDQVRDLHGLHVLDVKTGAMDRPGPNDAPTPFLSLWTQGHIYAAAVEAILKERPRTLTWLHLRDYIPYKAKPLGGPRGQVYYTVDLTAGALESTKRELRLFRDAVGAGRFERRPSAMGCAYCKVSEKCLAGFRGAMEDVAKLNVTEAEYGQDEARAG